MIATTVGVIVMVTVTVIVTTTAIATVIAIVDVIVIAVRQMINPSDAERLIVYNKKFNLKDY
jgi:glycerol-3-phosphate acyltransferase PlsY